MIEPAQRQVLEQKEKSELHRPRVIKWQGENMIRIHSLKATINEILAVSNSLDVVHIGIIGVPGSGKSSLAECIAHLCHKMSDVPFAVRIFKKQDLLNFAETLKTLHPANYILVFDDVSFLGATASKKQIEFVKQAMTEIRHLEGGKDVKIITILNYHYTLGLDKYLRQADFRYFTSVGSSELDNMEKIVGSKYMPRIKEFQKLYSKALTKKYFSFRIGSKEMFGYKYRQPFIPLLFYNNDTLRFVVSPLRQWIDKICSICAQHEKSEISLERFIQETGAKFGERHFKAAVRIELFANGMNTYGKTTSQARTYLSRALEKKQINLEELAAAMDLSLRRTKLHKKLDGVLTEQS